MSIKTLPSKWIKNKELIFLGMTLAFIVHFSGLPTMFATFPSPILLGVLLVGGGLSALIYVVVKMHVKI